MTTSPSASNLTPCPPTAPPWFVDARTEITQMDLGPHFQGLVSAWTRVEYASRFEHSSQNLSSKARPTQVGTWIGPNQRGKRGDPTKLLVLDPVAYALQWKAWWDSLQPEWRVRGEDGRWVAEGPYGPDGREWGPLYRWGVNGTLSLLAALYFWGCAVIGDETLRLHWEEQVNDVGWMMEGMATYYEMFKRRF
ncbi:hypothetical protein C8R43DRAFT_902055 [Mycena crocata]|nr:hypothetical protein C8R43DRAFT_902055 [Mycena crocata]